MFAIKVPVVFYFVKEQAQFDVGNEIIQSSRIAFFKNVDNFTFARHDKSLVKKVVDGTRNEELIDFFETMIDAGQLFFHGNPQIPESQ